MFRHILLQRKDVLPKAPMDKITYRMDNLTVGESCETPDQP